MRYYYNTKNIGILFILLLIFLVNSLPLYAQDLSKEMREKLEREITLDLRDMDIVDVFKFISMKGDFSIVVGKDVTGRVTLVLKKVKIRDALDIICLSNNLGYRVIENIIYATTEQEYLQTYGILFRDKRKIKIVYLQYTKPSYALEALKNIKSEIGKIVIDEDTGTVVMVDTPSKLEEMQEVIQKIEYKLETKIFTLNYAKAASVKEKLREKLDVKSVGSIEADDRSNQIIVTALPERFKEVIPIIEALDKKTKEVLIKVKILKVVLNPEFDFGIDWTAVAKGITYSANVPIASTLSTAGTFGKITASNMDLDDVNFSSTLKALKQVNDTKVLANPKILVTDNEEAKIHIGDKLAYVTTTTIGTGADQTANEEVHFIDVGILLNVKPTISDDGFIRMSIKPEISSQSSTLETPQGAEIPLINTTTLETNIVVKDGTTVIIGGLHKDEEVKKRKGLPFIMDFPFVGKFFTSVSDSIEKTEIAIFMTPYIVKGDTHLTDHFPDLSPPKTY